MCDCKTELEAKLTERFNQLQPKASGHKVELQGYGIVLSADGCKTRAYMPYRATAQHQLKNGSMKVKSETGNMFFSFCPFCGEKQA